MIKKEYFPLLGGLVSFLLFAAILYPGVPTTIGNIWIAFALGTSLIGFITGVVFLLKTKVPKAPIVLGMILTGFNLGSFTLIVYIINNSV